MAVSIICAILINTGCVSPSSKSRQHNKANSGNLPAMVNLADMNREPTLSFRDIRQAVPEGIAEFVDADRPIISAGAAVEYFYGTVRYQPDRCFGLEMAFKATSTEKVIPFAWGIISTAYFDGLGLERDLERAFLYANLAMKESAALYASYKAELQDYLATVASNIPSDNLAEYTARASNWTPPYDDVNRIRWDLCPTPLKREYQF
ncbi:MAG: hypothetical protein KDE14_13450 [Rhodobacteraceae bacterium]|nr:hypothetical protein [Paracoccaceae bacterium]